MLNQSHHTPTIDLAELDAAMHQAPGARAPLIVWMMDHHDDLIALFARRRVNWTRFCSYIADHGFLNGKGEPLKPEAVRQCWKRARAVIARQRALPPLPRTSQSVEQGAATGRPSMNTAPVSGTTPSPAAPAKFKPVSLKPLQPVSLPTPEEEAERAALRQRLFGSSE
ncbi:hypothetical protein [Acidiphilium acidophilum]|uniref:DUF1376 domain-containing protein n=1 Tax=Acidiphilium acidophilum TaxID=76588 RepID=A0AAW9DMY1_ACIAO|nr:hypothetical protein [Acidiphilium acidophilum]MDX5929555.1 hypothetical protein [Acidiphilium acidophilum]MEE3504469.1 hypothetical protein [Acidiphilium acidophilum]